MPEREEMQMMPLEMQMMAAMIVSTVDADYAADPDRQYILEYEFDCFSQLHGRRRLFRRHGGRC